MLNTLIFAYELTNLQCGLFFLMEKMRIFKSNKWLCWELTKDEFQWTVSLKGQLVARCLVLIYWCAHWKGSMGEESLLQRANISKSILQYMKQKCLITCFWYNMEKHLIAFPGICVQFDVFITRLCVPLEMDYEVNKDQEQCRYNRGHKWRRRFLYMKQSLAGIIF